MSDVGWKDNSIEGRRIFIDGRMVGNTGIGTHILGHLRGLAAMGASITATCQSDDDERALLAAAPGTRIIRSSLKVYGVLERLQMFAVPRNGRQQDVFWFPQYNTPMLLPRRSVVSVHDLIQFQRHPQASRGRQRIAYSVLTAALLQAKCVICPSEATRRELLEFYGQSRFQTDLASKAFVVRNGVSQDWQHADPEAVDQARSLTRSAPFFLCVGNGKPHKNVELALQLIRRLRGGGWPHHLALVGPPDPSLFALLGPDWQSMKEVSVIGRVSERLLGAFYSTATALLMPSLHEGFGLPPLEAMMSGLPVVASNRGGLPESVGSTSEVPLLDPLDHEAWYQEMVRLVADDDYRQRRIASGLAWALQMTWDRTTPALAEKLLRVSRT